MSCSVAEWCCCQSCRAEEATQAAGSSNSEVVLLLKLQDRSISSVVVRATGGMSTWEESPREQVDLVASHVYDCWRVHPSISFS